MPRNITVTFDDGSTHVYQNAPDDVTPEQVTQRAQKEFSKNVKSLDGGRQQSSIGIPEMLKRPESMPESAPANAVPRAIGVPARSINESIAGGLDAIVGFPYKLAQLAGAGLGVVAEEERKKPPYSRGLISLLPPEATEFATKEAPKPITRLMELVGVLPEQYKPQNETEKYLAAVGSGIGGAMAGGGINPQSLARSFTAAAGAGIGAQTAADIAPNSPLAQLSGSLAGAAIGNKLGGLPESIQKVIAARPSAPMPNTPQAQTVATAERAGITPTTTDIFPPTTKIGRQAQISGESVPFVGTGPVRANQVSQRAEAVQKVVSEYGADYGKDFSKAIADDLLGTKSAFVNKYSGIKERIKSELSGSGNSDLEINTSNSITENAKKIAAHVKKLGWEVVGGDPIQLGDASEMSQYIKIRKPFGYDLLENGTKRPSYDTVTIRVSNHKNTSRTGTYDAPDINIAGKGELYSLRQELEDAVAKKLDERGADYSDIAYNADEIISSKLVVPTNKAAKQIDDEIASIQRKFSGSDAKAAISELSTLKSDLASKDIFDLEDVRKVFGEKLASPDSAGLKNILDKGKDRIYGALKSDIEGFIKQNAGGRSLAEWRLANGRLSQMIDESKRTSLGKVLNKADMTPESVKSMLSSANESDVRRLYQNLSETGRSAGRSAIIQNAYDASFRGGNFSPDAFVTAVNKELGKSGYFFNSAQRRQLEGLKIAFAATSRAPQAATILNNGGQVAVPATISSIVGLSGGAGAGLAAFGTIGALARAYESKPVRDFLIKLAAMPKDKAVKEAEKLIPLMQLPAQSLQINEGQQ